MTLGVAMSPLRITLRSIARRDVRVGRRSSPAKRVYGHKPVSRVQIPPSPYFFTNFTKRFQKTTTRTIDDIKITKANLNDYHKKEFPNLHDTLSPVFVDIYGESFLWNMVRKMMRVFVDVAIGKLSLEKVEELLNPAENDPRANIKVLDPDYLILMDIKYDGVKFFYDDYACERFKINLVDSLGDLQRKYAIRESMIKSLEDLNA